MAKAALTNALGKTGPEPLLHWLIGQDQGGSSIEIECTKSEFVIYFLSYLRNQTEGILQNNDNALQILQHQSTPEKLLCQRKLFAATVNPAETPYAGNHDNRGAKSDHGHGRTQVSPCKEKSNSSYKKPGRRVKTKLFNELDIHLSASCEKSSESQVNDPYMPDCRTTVASSTPLKNSISDFPQLLVASPVNPSLETSRSSSKHNSYSDSSRERCDTPRMHSRYSNRLSGSEKSINLGDYLTSATKISSKKKKSFKNASNDSVDSSAKTELDLGNVELFPEIGVKRHNQSSEKRRIKPTNIDASTSSSSKSFTMNSFSAENFQQPPMLALEENVAFKQQMFQPKELSKSFDTERSMLKQERHKLMEKFNILNTSNNSKRCPVTPQMKTVRKDLMDKPQTFIDGDFSKINFVEKLETLAKIYNVLIGHNLVLSISAEIYFMISIVLSKQSTEDIEVIENQFKDIRDNNIVGDFLLKSLHNCSYLAIKTLWMQRHILEVILDKMSLKLLGENKRVRAFYPDLAKYLLNLYSLKCEGEIWSGRDENSVIILESRFANGNAVVCFNSETDSVENFPSILSFHNFKKQRDMFYEILRWWSEGAARGGGGGGATALRPRVKALLALAAAPANHAHLARLLTAHMMADCLSGSHESKLSKLQRRLTGPSPAPAAADSLRLPRFPGQEEFYRDFLMAAESEAFRVHARDSLASELCTLDAGCLPGLHERAASADGHARQEYASALRRLRLLAKFLGLLAAAPYRPVGADCGGRPHAPPKDTVLQGDLALRNHSQPPIDLLSMLESSIEHHRLSVTIPWLIQYLAMMDYTSLRIKYYSRLLAVLFRIYATILRAPSDPSESTMKRTTVIFLKLCLGWLFELPHFPQESFYELSFALDENCVRRPKTDSSVDHAELVDETALCEVCPHLKEFNVLLLASHPCEVKDAGSTFRHITPVTMSLSTADRSRNKERELQARLEEELLRGQPSSTRRVLELVADRVTSAAVKELAGTVLPVARARCRQRALQVVQTAQAQGGKKSEVLVRLREMYSAELERARGAARETARAAAAARAGVALRALLASGAAAAPLEAVARRASLARVDRWLQDNWAGVGVLCKDIEAEMEHLLLLGEAFLPAPDPDARAVARLTMPAERFRAASVSGADLIIDLKELICQLLEYSECPLEVPAVLERARAFCRPDGVFATPPSRRATLQLSVELLVVSVSRQPESMTEELLNMFHALWDEVCPHRRRNDSADEPGDDERFAFDPRNFAPDDERMATPVSSDDEGSAVPPNIVIATDASNFSRPDRTPDSKILIIDNAQNKRNLKSKKEAAESKSKSFTKDHVSTTNTQNDRSKMTPESNDRLAIDNVSKSDEGSTDIELSKSDMNSSRLGDCAESGDELLDLFNRILCPRNIMILSESRCDGVAVWEAMTSVLVFLLKNDYVSEDSLTEQCLAVYRQDWPQRVLERLSECTRGVAARRGRAAGAKFTLFLDFLAEFCGDMRLERADC